MQFIITGREYCRDDNHDLLGRDNGITHYKFFQTKL